MRKLILFILLAVLLTSHACAMDITAPEPPEYAQSRMPSRHESFGQGLLEVLRDTLLLVKPDLKEAAKVCAGVIAAVMAVSILRTFQGSAAAAADLAGCIAIASILLRSANSMVRLGADTVYEISEYGKLLLPAMTAALAAQGGVTASAALYAGTAAFDTLLSSLISKVLTPMVYLFLALAVAASAVGAEMLAKLRDTLKAFMTWILKTLLYIFTGYIGITGVISGSTDAAALKAAKLAISGAVPVVGGILSDASEAVLVSAGTVKNSVGIYGLFAILAIWLEPFLKIGAHYLLLKAAGALCGVFGSKQSSSLIGDFTAAMGLLLGMTGAVCLMLLISLVCFMKGVG